MRLIQERNEEMFLLLKDISLSMFILLLVLLWTMLTCVPAESYSDTTTYRSIINLYLLFDPLIYCRRVWLTRLTSLLEELRAIYMSTNLCIFRSGESITTWSETGHQKRLCIEVEHVMRRTRAKKLDYGCCVCGLDKERYGHGLRMSSAREGQSKSRCLLNLPCTIC